MKKKKEKSLKQLKALADDAFQMWVRQRDDWTCIICGVRILSKTEMHAGHYINRNNLACRYNEYNVNAQCRTCNGKEHWSSNKNPYAVKLIEKYGTLILYYLDEICRTPIKLSKADYIEMIKVYESKTREYLE